jgi:hypothetical protein
MCTTIFAPTPAHVAGSARQCASRRGATWLGYGLVVSPAADRMHVAPAVTAVNTNKPSTRWSRRRPT